MNFTIFINIIVPIASKIITYYIKTTETKKDDELLELAKTTIKYFADNTNNTVTTEISKALNDCSIISNCQKSKD